jgi:hypothetical protein
MCPREGGRFKRLFRSRECFSLRLGLSLLCFPSLIFGSTVSVRSLFSTIYVKDPCVLWSTNSNELEGVHSMGPISRDSRSHSTEADLGNGYG